MFDARPAPTRRRFPTWFLALGVLLGLNLLVLLYVLLRDERAEQPASPPAPVAAVVTPAPAETVAPTATPTAAATPARAPTPVSRAPAAVTARSAALPDAAPEAPSATVRAPSRDDLLAAGGTVPEARVSLHVYDADPAKRFVFLNGQRLREGDVSADGLRVERIEADGVVLGYRGSGFKVPLEP